MKRITGVAVGEAAAKKGKSTTLVLARKNRDAALHEARKAKEHEQ